MIDKIVVADDRIPFLKGVLEPYFREVRYCPGAKITADTVRDAAILITRTRTRCNAGLLADSRVEMIQTATIGYDHLDTAYLDSRGIRWNNSPGCNAPSVRQYLAAALLETARRHHFQLAGKTLAVVGVGQVGSRVAALGRSWGMRVLPVDPPRARAEGNAGFVPLEQAVRQADILTFHVPLSSNGPDATWHLADAELLAGMKPTALLFNTSRGEVVDTAALKQALHRHRIAGAVLDVWENEPDIDRELLDLADIATPHIAGYSTDGKANGTAQCVNRIGQACGIPELAEWYPADLPPGPPEPPVARDLPPEEARRRYLANWYDIMQDDAVLRRDPACFERLRADYRVRREPPRFTLTDQAG